jgi:hypothetical protein
MNRVHFDDGTHGEHFDDVAHAGHSREHGILGVIKSPTYVACCR